MVPYEPTPSALVAPPFSFAEPALKQETEEPFLPGYNWCYLTVACNSVLFDKCMREAQESAAHIEALTAQPEILSFCRAVKRGVPSLVEDCLAGYR
jgi:hypothetical protein